MLGCNMDRLDRLSQIVFLVYFISISISSYELIHVLVGLFGVGGSTAYSSTLARDSTGVIKNMIYPMCKGTV